MTDQLAPAPGSTGIPDDLVERAVVRADQWARAGSAETATGPSAQLAALMHDPAGVDFTLRFVDRVARPGDDDAAARELAHLGVTANVINPGATDTGWMDEALMASVTAATPLGRVGRPEDVANLVSFLCSDEGGWINGQLLMSNGGAA